MQLLSLSSGSYAFSINGKISISYVRFRIQLIGSTVYMQFNRMVPSCPPFGLFDGKYRITETLRILMIETTTELETEATM
jgi:hypothetical protein